MNGYDVKSDLTDPVFYVIIDMLELDYCKPMGFEDSMK